MILNVSVNNSSISKKMLKGSNTPINKLVRYCPETVLYFANKQQCYHFVEELNYNCKGIGDLNNYIDYDMLSGDLKKIISKDDFIFSNTEE